MRGANRSEEASNSARCPTNAKRQYQAGVEAEDSQPPVTAQTGFLHPHSISGNSKEVPKSSNAMSSRGVRQLAPWFQITANVLSALCRNGGMDLRRSTDFTHLRDILKTRIAEIIVAGDIGQEPHFLGGRLSFAES